MRKTLALTCMLLVVCCIFTGFAETIDTQTLFGKETDGVYENTFIGLGCELSGWYFYSEDDIARVNQWTKENMPEKVNEILEQAGNITIMAAESESGRQNINIQLQYIKEYLPIYNLFGIENVVKSQLDGITSVFEEAGMKNVHADMTEMLVCGKKCHV